MILKSLSIFFECDLSRTVDIRFGKQIPFVVQMFAAFTHFRHIMVKCSQHIFMLCAKRKNTGEIINAYFASKAHGPFVCSDCGDEVILKTGRRTVNHFAHVNPLACQYAENESDEHRRWKMEIFLALQKEPHVRNAALARTRSFSREAYAGPGVLAKIAMENNTIIGHRPVPGQSPPECAPSNLTPRLEAGLSVYPSYL